MSGAGSLSSEDLIRRSVLAELRALHFPSQQQESTHSSKRVRASYDEEDRVEDPTCRKLPRLLFRRQGQRWSVTPISDASNDRESAPVPSRKPAYEASERKQRSRSLAIHRAETEGLYTRDELAAIDSGYNFVIPTKEKLDDIKQRVLGKMAAFQVEDVACGVCEVLKAPEQINKRMLSPELVQVSESQNHRGLMSYACLRCVPTSE